MSNNLIFVLQIYTDASTNPAIGSGIGIFFGEGHQLNQFRYLDNVHNSGLAEVIAARTGLDILRAWPNYRSSFLS